MVLNFVHNSLFFLALLKKPHLVHQQQGATVFICSLEPNDSQTELLDTQRFKQKERVFRIWTSVRDGAERPNSGLTYPNRKSKGDTSEFDDDESPSNPKSELGDDESPSNPKSELGDDESPSNPKKDTSKIKKIIKIMKVSLIVFDIWIWIKILRRWMS